MPALPAQFSGVSRHSIGSDGPSSPQAATAQPPRNAKTIDRELFRIRMVSSSSLVTPRKGSGGAEYAVRLGDPRALCRRAKSVVSSRARTAPWPMEATFRARLHTGGCVDTPRAPGSLPFLFRRSLVHEIQSHRYE